MSEQDQIKAIAELDFRIVLVPCATAGSLCLVDPVSEQHFNSNKGNLPDYLHSYDAIIPVIDGNVKTRDQWGDFCSYLRSKEPITERWTIVRMVLLSPPSQLCEALLRSTGKWKP